MGRQNEGQDERDNRNREKKIKKRGRETKHEKSDGKIEMKGKTGKRREEKGNRKQI